jgi:hypothetical protein
MDVSGPEDIQRTLLQSPQIHVIAEMKRHAYETCREAISQEYIHKSLKTCKNGYLYTKGNEIIGFVIWKIVTPTKLDLEMNDKLPSKYLFVQLVCAKSSGGQFGYTMLFDVEQYCAAHSIPMIILEPIHTTVENYYRSAGFRLLSLFPTKRMTKAVDIQSVGRRDKRIIKYLVENGESLERQIMEEMQKGGSMVFRECQNPQGPVIPPCYV